MQELPSVGTENWTYHHALSHLKAPVARMRREHARSCREPASSPMVLQGQQAIDFVQERMQYLTGWAQSAAPAICRDLAAAWNSSNKSASPETIEEACKDYCDLMAALIEWERKVGSAYDPSGCWTEVFTRLRGATREWFEQLADLPDFIDGALNGTEGGQKKINFTFKSPPLFNGHFSQLIKRAYRDSKPFWQRRPFTTGALAGALFGLTRL